MFGETAISFYFALAALTTITCGEEVNLESMMDDLTARGDASETDRDAMKEMFANMKQQQDELMRQKEELQKLQEQQQQQQAKLAAETESGIVERDENAEKFQPQGTLEKITKKDGSSFYTRIVSSEDTPSSDWGPEYDMPESGDAGDLAIRGKDSKPKAFTMPANRDMKEVLKEIMANDGDVRKVPGLKPWRPSDEKRNENQIGWDDDDESGGWDDQGADEQEEAPAEEIADDGTGVVSRSQGGTATSLSDANHQISMLKIDLQTLKQEKTMKEKSSALQIANLNQKLQETRRVMEDMKISSKREKDSAIDLKRRVDELEEELDASRKRLAGAESEKKAVDDRVLALEESGKASEKALTEKDAALTKLKSEHDKTSKEVQNLLDENQAKDTEWNKRWMERHSTQEATMQKLQEMIAKEKKNAKKATTQQEAAEEELAKAKREGGKLKKDLKTTTESLATANEALKTTSEALGNAESDAAAAREAAASAQIDTAAAREAAASAQIDTAAAKEELAETKKRLEETLTKETTVATEARKAREALEVELDESKLREKQYLPIIIGLAGFVAVLLLFNCLRLCCSGGKKRSANVESERDPDVNSTKTADIVESTPKKSKKKQKKDE